MSLKDRLNRLTGEKPLDPKDRNGAGQLGELRKRIDEILERRPVRTVGLPASRGGSLTELVPDSEECATPFGNVLVVHGRTHCGSFHGRKRIGELSQLNTRDAAILAGHSALGQFDCRDALFLDTETTGLAGGTGTLAFLVGLGWYDGEAFVTRQLFARDFSEEPALLACLSDVARGKRFLVTYNGRAFDLNLLAARFVLNRQEDPLSGMPHLDLLHPSRRLLGYRLENSRLATIEEKILGHVREGDIPGFEIPQRYFDWLRHRDCGLILDVLEHNRLDVVSMAALLLHLCELLGWGTEAEGVSPSDVLAASRLCLERGESERAVRLLREVIASGDFTCRNEAHRDLSLILKRQGNWAEALMLWERMIAENPRDLFARIELAKWFEHRACDFERAADLALQALEIADSRETQGELEHRLNRIRRRTRNKPVPKEKP